MDQTSLNAVWRRIAETGKLIDGMVGRQGRTQDYLINLEDGRLWSRSHEIDVWVEASAIRSDAAPLRMPSRVATSSRSVRVAAGAREHEAVL